MQTQIDQAGTVLNRITEALKDDPENIERFIQLFKLANFGHLLMGISHTFNNVLGGILGYSQLLKEELKNSPDKYRQAEIIEKAAKRASRLISQLQFYSINNKFNKRVIDPKTIVAEVVSIVESSFRKNIDVKSNYDHGNAMLIADFPAVCHALLSICINAREAMPDGGEITITTCVEDVEVNDADVKKHVVFRIKDNGQGISAEYVERIFEPFFSMKEDNLASGLGLTIAENIIKEHNGKITVQSREGEGTMFNIYLPDARQSAGQFAAKRNDHSKKIGAGELIMVVDDEDDLRMMAQKILQKKGFNVLLAESGKHAIEIYERDYNKIRLVILDMIMPGLDGITVYKKLKNISTRPKLIITSGYVYNAPFQNIIDSGEVTFIPKPWDLPEFLDMTHRVLAG